MRGGYAPLTSPYPPDLSWRALKRRNDTGFSRIPSRLAHRARPIRQYQADATWSRLLLPSPAIPGLGCNSSFPPLLRQQGDGGLSPPFGQTAPRGALAAGAVVAAEHAVPAPAAVRRERVPASWPLAFRRAGAGVLGRGHAAGSLSVPFLIRGEMKRNPGRGAPGIPQRPGRRSGTPARASPTAPCRILPDPHESRALHPPHPSH